MDVCVRHGGVTYARLRGKVGPQLPCPDVEHPGTPRLFTDMQFPRADGRAALLARNYIEPAETPDAEYPFCFDYRPSFLALQHAYAQGRIPRLNDIEPDNFVETHPDDAARLGITAGDRIESNHAGAVPLARRASLTAYSLASSI